MDEERGRTAAPAAAPPADPAGGSSILTARFTLLLVFAVGGLSLTYLLFVRTKVGQEVDNMALRGRIASGDRAVLEADHALQFFTLTVAILFVAVIGTIAVVRRRPLTAAVAVMTMVAANLTTRLLKTYLLPRPELDVRPDVGIHNTFPSGHATIVFSFAVGLVLVSPRRFRGYVTVIAGTIAVGIAASTVTAGWHRASDVIGAFFVVVFWLAVAVLVLVALDRTELVRPPAPPSVRLAEPILAGVGVVLVGIGLFVLDRVVDAVRTRSINGSDEAEAYTAAVAAVQGVGYIVLAVVLAAVRRISFGPPRLHPSAHPDVAQGPRPTLGSWSS